MCICVCMCMYVYVCVYMCMYVYICVYMCVYVCMTERENTEKRVYIYIHTHIYTHIYSLAHTDVPSKNMVPGRKVSCVFEEATGVHADTLETEGS